MAGLPVVCGTEPELSLVTGLLTLKTLGNAFSGWEKSVLFLEPHLHCGNRSESGSDVSHQLEEFILNRAAFLKGFFCS